MNTSLARYFDDHLAGSSGALVLIRRLLDHLKHPEAIRFFKELQKSVEEDRERLIQVQKTFHPAPSALLQAAGDIASRVGSLKFAWEGTEPGELGMFEIIEVLALGVQGKHLFWRTLEEIRPAFPEWSSFDFTALEKDAIRQRDGVEHWRRIAARETFVADESGEPGTL